MQRRRPLQVENGVILGKHELSIGLLPHLDVGDRIMAVLDVGNLSHRVLRSVVEQRDWNHSGQSTGNAAGEEKVKADLGLARRAEIRRLMPGIYRGTIGSRLLLIGGVAQRVMESAVAGCGSKVELADGVADAIADVGGAVSIAGVGRLRHPDTDETDRQRSRNQANRCGTTLASGDGSLRKS